jgi:hypothetical protein
VGTKAEIVTIQLFIEYSRNARPVAERQAIGQTCNSAVDHEQENGIRYISHILTKYPIEAKEKEKEQHRVTSTSTPAEDEEE